MAQAYRSWLDRPIARLCAGVLFLACLGLFYITNETRLTGGVQSAAVGEDPIQRCTATRFAEIDAWVEGEVISAEQAVSFKRRAAQLCETNPAATVVR